MSAIPPKGSKGLRGQIIRSGNHGGYVITRETVEGMLSQLQSQPVPVNIEHDPTQPPVGRITGGRLVETDDGEVALETDMELFESSRALLLPAAQLEEALEGMPSIRLEPGRLQIGIDERSYPMAEVVELAQLASKAGEVTTDESALRFSQLPDALLVLALGSPAVAAWWFSRGFFTKAGEAAGERVGKEIGEDLVGLYRTFKARLRRMVADRRSPADRPPITMFTLELERPGGRYVEVEGSSRADDNELEEFLDAAADLLAVASAYQAVAPAPERLARLHFAWEDGGWRYRYGLDDQAQLVMIVALSDDQYAQALEQARAHREP